MKRFDELAGSTLGLNHQQCRALSYALHYGNISQVRLADLLDIAPISAGRLLDRMESEKWLERTPDPSDRRVWRVRPTEKGLQAWQGVVRMSEAVADEALADFDAEERAQFLSLFARAQANLSRCANEETEPIVRQSEDPTTVAPETGAGLK